jgi:hypothetical protein
MVFVTAMAEQHGRWPGQHRVARLAGAAWA